ncbi:MAG: chemotaxis protein CheR, partial [Clostridiales bacterium]|nr:chemotaxis protein CheR [Clostridiales bacterium]
PFKRKFHVIFCRNVMIYFDRGTRLKIVKKLYEYTEDGGYLFIGQSESLNKFETSFQYIKPSIYRKV